ncbi:MAG: DUF167 domain-containing protein [Candidatus Wildermuthbacteria bacterium]|nr:DUF167 domain-containing protein [Candidatus Wildermuthbacteria bacterium]
MTRIFVKAKPRAKEELVRKLSASHFAVWVKESPEKGRANKAIAKALAEYFRIHSGNLKLVSGFVSSQKVFELT